MKKAILLLVVIAWLPITAQAITVQFSGTLDAFNTGPFNKGDTFTGSFVLDEGVIPTGRSSKTFSHVVNDFILTIGGYTFTGSGGKVTQFSSASQDFFSLAIGGTFGTVSGSVGTDVFTKFTADWRGPNLFADPAVLAHSLTTSDFGYRRIVATFNSTVLDAVIDGARTIEFSGATPVPLPATSILVALGMFLLGLFRRIVRGTGRTVLAG